MDIDTLAPDHTREWPRVAFQGEPGAFSELAIQEHWPSGAEPVACRTFPDVLERLIQGHAEFAVLPIHNAIAGPVHVALHALQDAGTLVRQRAEFRVRIQLCIMAPQGSVLADIREVHSHPVALAQCRIYFARHAWLAPVPHDDTAGAAREVALKNDRTVAAIAGRSAAERFDLVILAENVEDVPANWTRFVVISAN